MVPDFDALFHDLNTRGWLVVEPPPIDHRETSTGAIESKLVRDFKNWMVHNQHVMLNSRRIGQYRWYLTIGAPYTRKLRTGEKQ
jgi:hypothetical protein